MVGEIAAMLEADLKSFDGLIGSGESVVLGARGFAAKEAAAVFQILESSRHGELGREVILQVSDAADHARRRTVREDAADDVVEFAGERQLGRGGETRIGV